MAYAALASLEQTIDQILNNDQYSTSPSEKHLIESLQENVVSFQSFLEEFPKKAKDLEGRMRDVATAAEDVIEGFMLKQIRPMWIVLIDGLARIKFKEELTKAAQKMDSIAAEVVEMKNSIIIEDEQLDDSCGSSSSDPDAGADADADQKIEMVGFDDDLTEIKARLLGESPKLQFLSIVGMGGIGKTTLAKNAYDDPSIQQHFDVRAWVTVSQDYRARRILSSLLDSMKEFDPRRSKQRKEQDDVEEMADRVYKTLNGRSYIIVMDDTWSTKVLDKVRKLFPDDGNGSRILLTTRQPDVAAYANANSSIPAYKMRLMDEDQSWELFRHKISPPPELMIIGKEIAKSCRGLPLAVVVIAGVLSTAAATTAFWREVAKNINSAASKDERLERILSLSYNHLPHRLRACLLYMGCFPEDYKIRVSELIKLWVAEGFLKHPKGCKSLEEGAKECVDDLVQRNLVLATERKSNGEIKSCSLHDMVRDSCRKLLQEDQNNLRHVRRKSLESIQDPRSLRSALSFDDSIDIPFEQFELLRVVHAPHLKCSFKLSLKLLDLVCRVTKSQNPFHHTFKVSPPRFMKLFHLRYLAFTACNAGIHSTISNFQNLQTLVILSEAELPSSIWKMKQLRHLIFSGRLPDLEGSASSSLENLHTLKDVNDVEDRAFLLKNVPNLRKLGLYYDEEGGFCGGRHLNASLACLHQLEKLKITLDRGRYDHFLDVDLPYTLNKCTLDGWKVSPSFLEGIGSLPNLQVLKLVNCSLDPSLWVVGGGKFPQLRFLLIDLVKLETLDIEDSSAFPRLKWLKLCCCFDLERISDDIGEIPTLELIEVNKCGRGVYEWARGIEEEQESSGNDGLQVRCIGG